MHLHARGVPGWAQNFVKLASARKSTEKKARVKTA
jgi:hypothetical protein